MVRHIMAVCVVCLLCADHLPCKQHDDELNRIPASTVYRKEAIPRRIDGGTYAVEKSHLVKRHTHGHDHHNGHHDHNEDDDHGEDEDSAVKEQLRNFTRMIFTEFGDPKEMSMNVSGFEDMLRRLNMYQMLPDSKAVVVEDQCVNSVQFLKQTVSPKHQEHESPMSVSHVPHNSATSSSSGSSNSITNNSNNGSSNSSSSRATAKPATHTIATSTSNPLEAAILVDESDLFNICPILLAQLTSSTSQERAGCITPSNVPNLATHYHETHDHVSGPVDPSVWVYSFLAVLGVSLCGLLGVAVIPCMDKHIYQHVLQFLVALAVGTLCGDALLHLLPHAMIVRSMANAHDEMMFKGLAAVAGIVFFYFMERLLTVIADWYNHEVKKGKASSRVRVMRDEENKVPGEKTCKHRYSSYPYCYDEIAMDTKDDHHEHNHGSTQQHHHHHNNHNNTSAKCANHGEHGDHNVTTAMYNSAKEDPAGSQDNNTISTNLDDASINSELASQKPKLKSENFTIILREHETKHHGHSHSHGHVHSPPGSFSAVAWMVIMGDGLHNFTDGMTIGAAFANNVAGGFSTAIAVFCHELPHELGDFAVLLKAGMSARDAVYYNLLSSILSFIGMVIGILIGQDPKTSAWVFSVAAGLFLYIALVDMIPELTSAHGSADHCKTSELLLQFLGMTSGFGIMLLIAMYEHDLKEMFVD